MERVQRVEALLLGPVSKILDRFNVGPWGEVIFFTLTVALVAGVVGAGLGYIVAALYYH
jgi:hypothetical protein